MRKDYQRINCQEEYRRQTGGKAGTKSVVLRLIRIRSLKVQKYEALSEQRVYYMLERIPRTYVVLARTSTSTSTSISMVT